MEDAILFSSCFDANGGVFEALLGAEDAIISDALNHASIIDGVRLCKARRLRYANNDMSELEARLIEAKDARSRLIVTDGVFSMDGIIANLAAICDLAERHDALVMVDDSHAVGFIGARGAGTPERADEAHRMTVVDHDERVMPFGEVRTDRGEIGDDAVHRENAVEVTMSRERASFHSIRRASSSAMSLLE